MRILTAAEMRAAEAAAVLAGTSYEQLMENAGAASAALAVKLADEAGLPHAALFLCGRGNNAGDAFVAARLLSGLGWRCSVLPLLGGEYSRLARRNWERLPRDEDDEARPPVRVEQTLPADITAPVVVDGVFGTGFHGQLPPNVQAAFRLVNAAGALRIALDVPSGMNCDTGALSPATFHAAHTVTFAAYKPGLFMQGNNAYTGQVHCVDIGM